MGSKTTQAPAPAGELLDPDALGRSLNGFDQLAIRERFRTRVMDLAQEDETMFLRSLLFIVARRDGAKDADAFRSVMELSLEDVLSRFERGEPDEDDEDAAGERDRQWAEFVIGTRLSYTVREFMELTVSQRAAALEAARERNGG